MVKIINTSRQISAPLDRAWEIISKTDGEPRYWRGLNAVHNVSKKGNVIEREVTLGFRDLKGHQTVALYPKKSIELTLTKRPMISTRIITLIPSSRDNEIKTTTIRVNVSWDIESSDNIPLLFRGIVRERIAEETEEALDRILPAQSSSSTSVAVQSGKHGIIGLAIHLAGFVLGFIGIGLVLGGVIDIESGITILVPFADLLYGLGLVIVVAVAARAGLPMKYLLIAGAIIGIGLFYKSAPHEIHIASGIGFGLVHQAHTMLGMILIALSLAALAVLAIRYNNNNKSLVIKG